VSEGEGSDESLLCLYPSSRLFISQTPDGDDGQGRCAGAGFVGRLSTLSVRSRDDPVDVSTPVHLIARPKLSRKKVPDGTCTHSDSPHRPRLCCTARCSAGHNEAIRLPVRELWWEVQPHAITGIDHSPPLRGRQVREVPQLRCALVGLASSKAVGRVREMGGPIGPVLGLEDRPTGLANSELRGPEHFGPFVPTMPCIPRWSTLPDVPGGRSERRCELGVSSASRMVGERCVGRLTR
jgi:hypothetical protein